MLSGDLLDRFAAPGAIGRLEVMFARVDHRTRQLIEQADDLPGLFLGQVGARVEHAQGLMRLGQFAQLQATLHFLHKCGELVAQ